MSNDHQPGGAPILLIGLAALGVFVLISLLAWGLGIDHVPRAADPTLGEDPAESFSRLTSGGVQDTGRVVTLGQLGTVLTESSGVAVSRAYPDVVWSHNDGAEGRLYALHTDGTLVASFDVGGGVEDWEDIDLGACPADGPSERDCLYVGDTGDNAANRDGYAVDIVPEPDPSADASAVPLRRVRFVYPDGPADTEGLAVTPGGEALMVTKGSDGTARLYRLSMAPDSTPAAAEGEVRAAVLVGALPLDVTASRDRITAAAVSPDGTLLAVRNHHAVYLFPLDRPLGAPVLCEIGAWQPQGEGMDFLADDMLILTSEQEGGRSPIVRLRCP